MTNEISENEFPIKFEDNDHDYLAWTTKHPEGYVLTSNKSLTPRHTVIHRATCTKITTLSGNAQPGGFTNRYIKVCAKSIDTLQVWALERRSDAKTRECTICAGK